MSSEPLICAGCSNFIQIGEGDLWVVSITAVAEPGPPELPETRSLEEIRLEMEAILKQLENVSEQEAKDAVFRRLVLHLCAACYRAWIEDPTGSG